VAAILRAVMGLLLGACVPAAAAPQQTVCTITVNSADEREAFRRHLPPARYRFVELVERGRPDWLAAACRAGVRCDVLIVSGHYDGGQQFFSDRLDVDEHLPVAELERASCSASCSGLFAQLREVHLYGCNTLNPNAQSGANAEVVRSLVRESSARPAAALALPALGAGQGESSRERMRQIFKGVPVIYGFSSMAPLGPVAAQGLERWFRGGGAAEVARGRPSGALLAAFAPSSLAHVGGVADRQPPPPARRDMCRLADEEQPLARRIDAVHEIARREPAAVWPQLDRIQRVLAALDARTRRTPEVAAAFGRIAADADTRQRWLDRLRGLQPPAARVRVIGLLHDLGWLSDAGRRIELALVLGELQEREAVGLDEINLACTLNADGELDGAFARRVEPGRAADLRHAAVRACLGSSEAQRRTLRALLSDDDAEVQVAQAYLRQRPLADAAALHTLAEAIVAAPASDAQVRALETLGRHYLSEAATLRLLLQLYESTPSAAVQTAVAGILIRADRGALDVPAALQVLQLHRLPATEGQPIVDALIRRLAPG
jgi:hypothetical protein